MEARVQDISLMGFNEQNTISNVFYAIVKGRFGKQSEIVKTYAKDILNLPHIPTSNVKKIHEFHDKRATLYNHWRRSTNMKQLMAQSQ